MLVETLHIDKSRIEHLKSVQHTEGLYWNMPSLINVWNSWFFWKHHPPQHVQLPLSFLGSGHLVLMWPGSPQFQHVGVYCFLLCLHDSASMIRPPLWVVVPCLRVTSLVKSLRSHCSHIGIHTLGSGIRVLCRWRHWEIILECHAFAMWSAHQLSKSCADVMIDESAIKKLSSLEPKKVACLHF